MEGKSKIIVTNRFRFTDKYESELLCSTKMKGTLQFIYDSGSYRWTEGCHQDVV